ncbi:MAG: thymidine phosphorylase [Gemmatimonadaceae bacterium]|nr:thymidine phosphorylase [Gemmatimonadaceae bacterium]
MAVVWAVPMDAPKKQSRTVTGGNRIGAGDDGVYSTWYTRGWAMIVPRLIERKRDGGRLEDAEWHALIQAYARDEVPDYQMSALLMAIYFKGLDRGETNALTDSMIESGARLDLSHLNIPRIDKHSTGGVGDKVSLVLAPLIASLGVAVPMMSGRGLGHTGGTLDKLESIPGFRTNLSLADAARQVESIGCALIGQTGEIAPADRKLYALRDATATVEAIPLIAASIMSKKLAEGLTGLVLDVKEGSGAFIPDPNREGRLAKAMIELGADRGCPVVALQTAMDRPLGFACGNALEVRECIDALEGNGPPDLMEVTYALGAEMLILAGVAGTAADAWRRMREAIRNGGALAKFAEIIAAQGGDARVLDDPSLLPSAARTADFLAGRDGFVTDISPRTIGYGIIALRGGRRTMEDTIDPGVGFVITAKPGAQVTRGQALATIHARDEAGIREGKRVLSEAITIDDQPGKCLDLISMRISREGAKTWQRPAVA